MKHKILLVFVLLSSILSSQEMTVITYNLKYDDVKDTVNNWNNRKEAMVRLLQYYNPLIFGTQEALHHQTAYLDNGLPSYSYVGVGRDDGKQKGEYTAIHFDSTKVKVLETKTFWLSATPKEISVGWDAALERICTYALFQNLITKKQFYVFNTHFDHIGQVAREKSAELIAKKIETINTLKLPVVLIGDFNLTPDETPIQYLNKQLEDSQLISEKPHYGPTGTFSGFDWNMTIDKRIDYIFTQGFIVKKYLHIDDRMENNKHISDHLPVLATLTFSNN